MSNITLENVSRAFGSNVVVDGVNLNISPGEFVTLLGPSGCGKTTTLRMVAGLERNSGGTIKIGDAVVSDASQKIFVPPERRSLGMVFQSYAIWPHMTVFENVAYPLKVRRMPERDIRTKVDKALRLVEMERFAERPAPALSGGQQQRIAIARALVFEPKVLLLDEPMSNLDSRLRTQMGDDFRELQQRLKITTLYVTHDQAEAMSLSDRVAVMSGGEILQISAPSEIYHRPANRQVAEFFGSPNLLKAMVVGSSKRPDGLFNVRVRGSGWQGSCTGERDVAPFSEITVMIRSENFRCEAGLAVETGDVIHLSGTVKESVFRGPTRSLAIANGEQCIRVEAPSMTNPAVGSEITLFAKSEGAWVLDS
ncbi:ABC transporter ATP-binding protein [Paraburkholderia fynbosensis]|uniref:Spermidine/putrescine import ATP-binding protein PotA n=1 Tax=Paraburkholderia fynbosensis TaxID=1200993 RepID=A0A6J5GU26_9BURK|nr:ABC transporter ATP-binding protein [Paraburkholderia fynbosensis]CAB3806922.1 Spermidine/putrescine import ATP-binding protein PotA [Paraburkholderia fynbosensis]